MRDHPPDQHKGARRRRVLAHKGDVRVAHRKHAGGLAVTVRLLAPPRICLANYLSCREKMAVMRVLPGPPGGVSRGPGVVGQPVGGEIGGVGATVRS